MISLNNVGSAGQALHYFSKDNYYTQDQGLEHSEWFGNGAEHLGLSGQIDRAAFFALLEGKVEGQELGKWVRNEETGEKEREHRPGTDMTFSAPKSVSLVAEIHGTRDVREAHEAAVKKALGYIERELAQTRQTEGGKTEAVKTGNLTVAMFRHNTSRELDPQTHTHAVIMNATKREDGQWRSLTNEEIYNAQRVIGAIYTSELADRLQALGYDIRRTDEKGNFEIAGITREQIEHFSQRRAEIEAALKAKGVDIDDASAQQKEDATLKTRARKVDVDHDALIADWRARAKEVGIDFDAIQAKADAQRAQGGVIRDDKLSGRQAMEFAAAHLIEREAVVSKNDLMAAAIEHGAGRVSASAVQRAFDKLEQDGDLVKLPDGGYTTKKMLGSEMWALDQVRAQKGQTPRMMEPEAVAARIAQAEGRQGFKYSDGQKDAISKVLTSQDRYVAVQGLAGTGKTTMLKSLRELAQEQGYTVRGMAPTGAASKVLARETGIATDTVSMFQIKERQLQKDIEFAKQYAPDFVRKAEVWIVDESSFLSQRQKAQLDHMAEKAGAKVVYLGDTLQLQGVEAGKPFELAQKDGIETAYMTEINRQKTPDLKQAVDVITGRDGLQPGQRLTQVALANNARAFAFMDKTGMVREVKGDSGQLIGAVVDDILKLGKAERERTIVITAYNEDRRAINAGVREGLKAQGELSRSEDTREILVSKGWTRAMQKEAQYYQAGDVVRFGRDYQQIDAKKGEYMRVAAVDAPAGTVVLKKEDGSTIAWQPKKHNKIEVYDSDTRTYETVFGVPDELGLQKGDVAFGHRILKSVNNATVRDPQLRSDLMQFIKECTLYDIKDGVVGAQEIVGGTDTWNTIFSNTSPARFATYDTLTPEPKTEPCTDVAIVLKDRVADAAAKAQIFYGKQAFSRASTDAIAESMFVSAIGTSYDWILNNSSNASAALRQSMFNNIWKEAGSELPALLNDPARVAEVNALMASAQAARQAAGANASISILAQETLPHIRNWIEAIIYAMFPIVVVLMVVMTAQGAKQILGGYMMALAWIGMWPVLFAVINHLSMMHLRYKMRALELATGSGIPFQLSDVFDATLTDEQSLIGYMVLLVPFLAAGIIKMGQGGIMSLADRMTASFSSAVHGAGYQTSIGNVSMGQVGMDSAGINTTSMHKYDSNMALSGGGAMIGTGSGGTATIAPNGAVAMNQLHNRMLQQMGMDHRYEAGRNQEAHRTDITSSGDQLSYRHGDSSTGNSVVGADRTRGAYQQSGVSASTTDQGGYGGAHTGGQSVGKTFRDGSQFNMQAGAQDNLSMNLGLSRPGPAAAGGGGGGGGAAPADPREEKRIADAIRNGGGNQAQVDQALKNYRSGRGTPADGGLLSRLSAGFGASSTKTYQAGHSRDRGVVDQHSLDESARTERTFQVSGQRTAQDGAGQQSQQTSRTGRDAVLSNTDERSQIHDVSDRQEYGTGDRANRSESNSFTHHRDLLADPSFMEAVAARNGMSATRFYSQETPTIMSMVQDYAAEKGMVNAAQTLNTNTFAGETLPANKAGLAGVSEKERKDLPNDIAAKHKRKAAATGAGTTAPVRTNTSTPSIVGQSRGAVEGQLDPKNKGSIPARTGALDDNVHAWASPDKKVGEGRANPLGVVEDMEGRDIKDSALKGWDKLTGGDGTADGEKLTENMKRETSASPHINSGTKR